MPPRESDTNDGLTFVTISKGQKTAADSSNTFTVSSSVDDLAMALIESGVSEKKSARLYAAIKKAPIKSSKLQTTSAWNRAEDVYKETIKPTSKYYCTSCLQLLKNELSTCKSTKCLVASLNSKKRSWTERTWIGTYELKEQLLPIIVKNFQRIVDLHKTHHEGSDNVMIGDLSTSARYKKFMESKENFDKKFICLPISVGYDGFIPKLQKKNEITPIYVRLEGIGEKLNRTIGNVAVAAMIVTRGGLSHRNAHLCASRLHAELVETKISQWKVNFNGDVWSLTLTPAFLFGDLKGIRSVAGLPNWQSSEPCLECNVAGSIANKSYKFYNGGNMSQKRTLTEQQDMIERLKRWNVLSLLAPPWLRTFDELHVWSEGVAKDLARDMFEPTSTSKSKWAELKLSAGVITALNFALENVKNYTYSRAQVTCLRSRTLCSGSEIRELFRIILPVISCCGVHKNKNIQLFLMLLYAFMYGLFECETKDDVEELRPLADVLHNVHGTLNNSTYTLKCHDLYKHSLDSLLEMGSLRSQSCADFERYHSDLHNFAIRSSKSPANLMKRFLSYKTLKNIAHEDETKEEETEEETTLWATELSFDEDVEIPANSKVSDTSFLEKFPRQFQNMEKYNNRKFFSRCIVRKRKFSSILWTRETTTTAAQAIVVHDGSTLYVQILAFVVINNNVYVLIAPWTCANPIMAIEDHIQDEMTTEQSNVLSKISAQNRNFVEKVAGENRVLMIKAECLIMKRTSQKLPPVNFVVHETNKYDLNGELFSSGPLVPIKKIRAEQRKNIKEAQVEVISMDRYDYFQEEEVYSEMAIETGMSTNEPPSISGEHRTRETFVAPSVPRPHLSSLLRPICSQDLQSRPRGRPVTMSAVSYNSSKNPFGKSKKSNRNELNRHQFEEFEHYRTTSTLRDEWDPSISSDMYDYYPTVDSSYRGNIPSASSIAYDKFPSSESQFVASAREPQDSQELISIDEPTTFIDEQEVFIDQSEAIIVERESLIEEPEAVIDEFEAVIDDLEGSNDMPEKRFNIEMPLANDMLLALADGPFSKKDINSMLVKHKEKTSFPEEYQEALRIMKGKIQIAPLQDEDHAAVFLHNLAMHETPNIEIQQCDEVTTAIGRKISFNFDYDAFFDMPGGFWRTSNISLANIEKIPKRTVDKLSAIIQYVLLENPQEISYFTVRQPGGSNSQYIQFPDEVQKFLTDYILEAANFPKGILDSKFSLNLLEIAKPRLFETIDKNYLMKKTEIFIKYKNEASAFRFFCREKMNQKCGYLRECSLSRTAKGRVICVRMNKQEKNEWKARKLENIERVRGILNN